MAETTKSKESEKTIKIIVGNDKQINSGDWVNVGINGEFIKIPYGKEVKVTPQVLKLISEGGYVFRQVGLY